jgi:hypothetical protein
MRGAPFPVLSTYSQLLHSFQRIRREGDGLAVVLAGVAAGYGEDRRRPVTGDAVRGSRRAVGLAAEGRGEKLPPRNGESPGQPLPLTAGQSGRSFPSGLLAPVLAVYGRGRQARRAVGAPLKP